MKFCVIGLGRFGFSVAETLAHQGMEVIVIDNNMENIEAIKDSVTHAMCMQVTNEASLYNTGVEYVDVAIVGIGDDFAQAALVTAILKKRLRIGCVIARATTDLHKEILALIGADQVVMPEQELGIQLGVSLSTAHVES